MRRKLFILIFLFFVAAAPALLMLRPAHVNLQPGPETATQNLDTPSPQIKPFTFAVFGDSKMLPDRSGRQGNKVLADIVGRINLENPAL
ncbi:MAG: hypothetical protein ACOY30_13500 [Bacillota bacterium]